jgi:hypothetical protein
LSSQHVPLPRIRFIVSDVPRNQTTLSMVPLAQLRDSATNVKSYAKMCSTLNACFKEACLSRYHLQFRLDAQPFQRRLREVSKPFFLLDRVFLSPHQSQRRGSRKLLLRRCPPLKSAHLPVSLLVQSQLCQRLQRFHPLKSVPQPKFQSAYQVNPVSQHSVPLPT